MRQEIEQFYALQMQAIDAGDVDAWVASFTPDGIFDSNGMPEPGKGHDVLRAGARRAADEKARRGVTHRHVVSGLAVLPAGTDRVTARSYVLVVETAKGGTPVLFASTVMEDDLVRSADGWLVAHRRIRRDDLD